MAPDKKGNAMNELPESAYEFHGETLTDEGPVLTFTPIHTEDGKVLAEGDRAYNYYDMKPGTIRPGSITMAPDAWFDFDHDDGSRSILNGARICTIEYARRRGFPGA